MKKLHLKYALIIIFVLVLAVAASFILRDKASSKNDVQYREVIVKKGTIEVTASGTGNINPAVRKEIQTLANGIVDMVCVKEGQFVNKGDLILTFQNKEESSAVNQAKLDVLLEEEKLRGLKADLENLKIFAPVCGYVKELEDNIGKELSKGQTFATIEDTTRMETTALYNKNQVNNIKIGDSAEVFLLDNLTSVEGTVIKINEAPEADSSGGILYGVKIELANPGGLASGMDVQVTVKNEIGDFPAVKNSQLEVKEPYNIELKVGGTLQKVYVSEGDYVNQGDLLAELKNDDLKLQIKQQELKYEQSQLRLKERLTNLEDTAVYSPISGVVIQVNVTEGESVREGTVVAVVSDLANYEVVVPIDELDIGKIKNGQQAKVEVEASSKKIYKAEVIDIALEGITAGGVATYDVTLSLKESEGLKPGMTANAEIIVDRKTEALLLPIEVVQQRGNRKFVLTGSKQDLQKGELKTIPVKIGLVSEKYVEILEGLKEGDKVYIPINISKSQNQQEGPGFRMMGVGGGPPRRR